jgi:hypothetical protein
MAVWFCPGFFAEVLKILERDEGLLVAEAEFGGREEGFGGRGNLPGCLDTGKGLEF